MSKPKIIILETKHGVTLVTDQEIEAIFLDGFTEGIEDSELIEIDDEKYQYSTNLTIDSDPDEVAFIEKQIRAQTDPVCEDCAHFDLYDAEGDEKQEYGGCWKQHGTVHFNMPASSCEDFRREAD